MERRLSLLGLVEPGEETWREVADVYVWGEFQEVDYTDRVFEDVVVEFQLQMWSGGDDLITVVKRGRVGDFEAVAISLAEEVFDQARSAKPTTAEAARRAARKLDEQAQRVQGRAGQQGQPAALMRQQAALTAYRRAILEIAYFLDPDEAERYWTLLTMTLDRNAARFATAASRAEEMMNWWRQHGSTAYEPPSFQKFRRIVDTWLGLPPLLDPGRRQSSGIEIDTPPDVVNRWRTEIEERIVREVEVWLPFIEKESPRDMQTLAVEVLQKVNNLRNVELRLRLIDLFESPFRGRVAVAREEAAGQHPGQREHVERVLAQTEIAILRVFLDAGRLEDGVAWLGLDLEERLPDEPAEAEPVSPAYPLSRDALSLPDNFPWNPDRPAVPWESWRNPKPPVFEVSGLSTRPVSLAVRRPVAPAMRDDRVNRHAPRRLPVIDVLKGDGRYVWATGHSYRLGHSGGGFSVRRLQNVDRGRLEPILLRHDRVTGVLEELPFPEGFSSEVTDLILHNGELWLATAGQGVFRRQQTDGKWVQYRASDGLISDHVQTMFARDGRIGFIGAGGLNRLIGYFDMESNSWIRQDMSGASGLRSVTQCTLSGDWLFLGGSAPHLLHLPSGAFTDLTSTFQRAMGEQYFRLQVVDADDGFWIVSYTGTYFFNPEEPHKLERIHAFSDARGLMVADGKFLWVALGERPPGPGPANRMSTGRLLLINREWPEWLGAVPLPAAPRALDISASSVWVALEQPMEPVWEFRKPGAMQAILGRSEEEWKLPVGTVEERLIAAAARNDHVTFKALFSGSLSPDQPLPDGGTLLTIATAAGSSEIVEILLAAGANPNRTGREEMAKLPLLLAAELNHFQIVQMLLEAGARPNRLSGDSVAPIHAAARGAIESLQVLCKHGADVNMIDGQGWSPIHHAALHRFVRGIEVLAEHGADLFVFFESRYSPLLLSLLVKGEETAQLLLALGADVRGQFAAVEEAARHEMADVLRGLFERGAPLVGTGPGHPLPHAMRAQDDAIIRIFFDYGFDPRVEAGGRQIGAVVLSAAVRAEREWVVRELLERGANPDEVADHNRSPLASAVDQGNLRIAELLLEAGADPNGDTGRGNDILESAKNPEMRELLQRYVRDKPSAPTALAPPSGVPIPSRLDFILAEGLRHGYDDLAMRALRTGASPDARTRTGWPVMVVAAAFNKPAILEELIARGGDLNAGQRGYGRITPLAQAATRDLPEVAAILVRNGALFGLASSQTNVLEMARERGNAAVLAVLENPEDRNHANNALTLAITGNSLEHLQAEVARAPDLNVPDVDFRLPLILAVSRNSRDRLAFVRLLLENGADPNKVDLETGMPPLLMATDAGRDATGLVRLLVEYGADLNVVDPSGDRIEDYVRRIRFPGVQRDLEELISELRQAENGPRLKEEMR